MTILLATADDNLIGSIRTLAFSEPTCVVARSGVECLAELRRLTPDMLVLDAYLPWGGAEGVLAILEESREAWITEVPIVILTPDASTYVPSRLRVYRFPQGGSAPKLLRLAERFAPETAGPVLP